MPQNHISALLQNSKGFPPAILPKVLTCRNQPSQWCHRTLPSSPASWCSSMWVSPNHRFSSSRWNLWILFILFEQWVTRWWFLHFKCVTLIRIFSFYNFSSLWVPLSLRLFWSFFSLQCLKYSKTFLISQPIKSRTLHQRQEKIYKSLIQPKFLKWKKYWLLSVVLLTE